MKNTGKNKYRVAIVGAGDIARAHAKACAQTDQAELVAVCDVSQPAIDRFTEQLAVNATYTVLAEMLTQEQIDIAIICTWQVNHAEIGIRIAESKRVKAILCEKPLTRDAAEAEALVATCRNNGVFFAEAFKFRHHPLHLKTREIIDQGGIGEVMHVHSTFCHRFEDRQPHEHWYWERSKAGGAVYIIACYNIHHARFVFGEEPERVFATQIPGVEVDDAAAIVLIFSGGRTAQITTSFNSWHSHFIEIIGTRGLLRIDDIAWNNEDQAVVLKQQTEEGVAYFEFNPLHQFTHQLQHLCECLDTGAPHRISPENSIAQMQVIDGVFESIDSGKTVVL
jgi:predicted dehydrogenase